MVTKILLIGTAAREHAIAEALAKSENIQLNAFLEGANPGIIKICKETGGRYKKGNLIDAKQILEFAREISPDFAFVGPEEPQFYGVTNALIDHNIPCVGALKEAAMIEMSKAFMRRLMAKYKIPGRLRFKAFKNVEDALAYIKEYAESIAIKPARQAGGKGVKVIADLQAYLRKEKAEVKEKHAKRIYEQNLSKDIEDKILIEEKVEGVEYTVQCFTDGKHILAFKPVQDHPHAYDDDLGPETGGMGSIYSSDILPFLTKREYEESVKIIEKTIKCIRKETGVEYKGAISGQFMLTDKWGPTILEFYSRFGDPEVVNVFPILQNDVIDICYRIIEGGLNRIRLEVENCDTVVKCIAPKGYPEHKEIAKGHVVEVDEKKINELGAKVYYASVDERQGKLYTLGSRVIEIFAKAESIEEAAEIAEKATRYVRSDWKLYHRKDIGTKELLIKRTEQAQFIREIFEYRKRRGLVGKVIDWLPGKGRIEIEY